MLSYEEAKVLDLLWQRGAATKVEVARRLGTNCRRAAGVLAGLEGLGMVAVAAGTRRAVRLTARGVAQMLRLTGPALCPPRPHARSA